MSDDKYMQHALALAKRGQYTCSPNPMVGCVIVKNDKIIGEGWHKCAGKPHAEIKALNQAKEKASGATVYVTLEPCCHFGKTPPCTQALIKAKVARVVAACLDPNAKVSGKGIRELQEAGIQVDVDCCKEEAKELNKIHFHHQKTKRPYVIAKWAMSLDGETITHPLDDKKISSQESQQHAHQIRQQVDAILIGSNTAIIDNPRLTARHGKNIKKQPLRIVLTNRNKPPDSLSLFNDGFKTLVISPETFPQTESGKICLNSLLDHLGKQGISSLLVEGGKTTHQLFLKENLVNEIQCYLAPVLIGPWNKKRKLQIINLQTLNKDQFIQAQFTGNSA